jgi:O-antigen/teichoic acid export membrane protein
MSFWRRSLGSALIMVTQAVFTRGIGIVSSGILARMLTPSEWGALQAVINTAGTMGQVLKLSVDTGLQIRLAETEQKPGEPTPGELLGAGLLTLALLSLAALLLGSGSSQLSARLFGDATLAPWMSWAGWFAAGQLLAQIAAALMAFGAFRLVALAQVGASSVFLGLLILGYVLDVPRMWLGLSTQLFLQLGLGLVLLALTYRAWRARGIRLSLQRLGPSLGALLRLGLPAHAASAVPALLSLFVSANLARSAGLPALAAMRVVTTMNQLVTFLPNSMATAFLTEFAGARGGDSQVSHRDFLRYIRLIAASAIIAATTAAWTARWLVPLAFGDNYISAVKLVNLGVATAIVYVTKQAMVVGLMSERRTGYALLDSFLSSGAYAALAWLLTPSFGLVGMLSAELLGHSITLIVMSAILAKRFRTPETLRPARKTAGTMLLTLGMLMLALYVHDTTSGALLCTPFLIALSAGTPWLLFTRDEREVLSQMLRARLRR